MTLVVRNARLRPTAAAAALLPPAPPVWICRVAEEEWSAVRRDLSEEIEIRASSDPSKGATMAPPDLRRALRVACRHDPPLDVIQLLLDLCPDAASKWEAGIQGGGRYPLHDAVGCAASVEVIELLVRRHPDAASSQDVSGRTPLHELCGSYLQTHRERRRHASEEGGLKQEPSPGSSPGHMAKLDGLIDSYLRKQRSGKEGAKGVLLPNQKVLSERTLILVKLFRHFAPRCINLEDANGKTAVECAVQNCADPQTMKALQDWSQWDRSNKDCVLVGALATTTGKGKELTPASSWSRTAEAEKSPTVQLMGVRKRAPAA